MKRRTFLLGSGAVFGSAGFVSGSGAFSSAEVERNVDVAVVGDADAHLALTTDEDGEPTGLFSFDDVVEPPITVGNQLTQDLTVEIEINDTDKDVKVDPEEFDIGTGEEQDVELKVDVATEPVSVTLDFEATADEGTVYIDLIREIQLKPQILVENVVFFGTGNAEIDADPGGEIPAEEVTVWGFEQPTEPPTTNGDSGNSSDASSESEDTSSDGNGGDNAPTNGDGEIRELTVDGEPLRTSNRVNGQLEPSRDEAIIAIDFGNSAFVHPDWEGDGFRQPANEQDGIEVMGNLTRDRLVEFNPDDYNSDD